MLEIVQTSDLDGVGRGAGVHEDAAVGVVDRDRLVQCPTACKGGGQTGA